LKTIKKNESLITFVGIRQAKEGYTFIHQSGNSPHCKECKYYQICIKKLEAGRIYRIIGVRKNTFPCLLHEEGVRVVEVTESDILTTIPSKFAIEGAIIIFQLQDCNMQDCRNYDLCFPKGLFKEDRCMILRIDEGVKCDKDFSLVKVFLRRLSES
jgi:uncharacterized protein (UPF0179 family)